MNKKNNILIIAMIIFVILIAVLIINKVNTPKKGNLISITYTTLQEKIKNKDNFIFIVSQSTCTHCASYKKELKKIVKEYGIDIYYIDYDLENDNDKKEFLEKFNLNGSTPITLFINDGKETSILNRIEGETSKSKAVSKFKKMGFIN